MNVGSIYHEGELLVQQRTGPDGSACSVRRASGSPRTAKERAEDAVIRIEGSLVMARATGDHMPFRRTLRNLPQELLRS